MHRPRNLTRPRCFITFIQAFLFGVNVNFSSCNAYIYYLVHFGVYSSQFVTLIFGSKAPSFSFLVQVRRKPITCIAGIEQVGLFKERALHIQKKSLQVLVFIVSFRKCISVGIYCNLRKKRFCKRFYLMFQDNFNRMLLSLETAMLDSSFEVCDFSNYDQQRFSWYIDLLDTDFKKGFEYSVCGPSPDIAVCNAQVFVFEENLQILFSRKYCQINLRRYQDIWKCTNKWCSVIK